jgi:hypothetical protein
MLGECQALGALDGLDHVPLNGVVAAPHACDSLPGRRIVEREDYASKRLLAIDVLLEEPEEISDGLEAELYALRDRLHLIALGGS